MKWNVHDPSLVSTGMLRVTFEAVEEPASGDAGFDVPLPPERIVAHVHASDVTGGQEPTDRQKGAARERARELLNRLLASGAV